MWTKSEDGGFDPPLPPPAERRGTRKAAGLTQTDLAAMLAAGDNTVHRCEKAVGHDEQGNRFPGREPVGKARRACAVLPEMAERYGESVEEEWFRRHGLGLP